MTSILFRTATPSQISIALAIVRVVVGIVFIAHGAQKIFTFGFAGVTDGFAQMGIPLPGITGPLAALVEFLGGIALVVGLLTRLAALGLAIDMLGAILLVHLPAGFFLPNGYEFALTLFAASIALMIGGPGEYSVDAGIGRRRAHATGAL